jgi:hypothetical protein
MTSWDEAVTRHRRAVSAFRAALEERCSPPKPIIHQDGPHTRVQLVETVERELTPEQRADTIDRWWHSVALFDRAVAIHSAPVMRQSADECLRAAGAIRALP